MLHNMQIHNLKIMKVVLKEGFKLLVDYHHMKALIITEQMQKTASKNNNFSRSCGHLNIKNLTQFKKHSAAIMWEL